MMKRTKLRTQLLILSLSIGILPCLLIGYIIQDKITSCMQKSLGTYSQKVTTQLNYNIDSILDRCEETLPQLAFDNDAKKYSLQYSSLNTGEKITLQKYVENLFSKYLKEIRVGNSGVIQLFNDQVVGKYKIVGQPNELLEAASKIIGSREFLESDQYKEMKSLDVEEYSWCALPEIDAILLATRLETSENSNDSIIIVVLPNTYFNEVFAIAEVDKEIPLLLVDEKGQVIFSSTSELIGEKMTSESLNHVGDVITSSDEKLHTVVNKYGVISYATTSNGWKVVIDAPSKVLMKGVGEAWRQIAAIIIVIIIFLVFASYLASKLIATPLKILSGYMKKIEEGQIDVENDIRKNVRPTSLETHKLVNGFCQMLSNFSELISHAKEVTDVAGNNVDGLQQIAKNTYLSAENIEKTINDIGVGMQLQNTEVETSLNSMEKLSNHIIEVKENILDVQKSSEHTIKQSKKANEKMHDLTLQTDETVTISKKISEEVEELGKEAGNINNILDIIKDVSDQIKLLSLNARIEAARAGEAGAGFAVVAQKVGELSIKTQDAVKMIANTLRNIQAKKQSTLSEMTLAMKIFEGQLPIVTSTKETFKDIEKQMQEVNKKIEKVTMALLSVVDQKEEVTKQMQEISTITNQTTTLTQKVGKTSNQQTEYAVKVEEMASTLADITNELQKAYSKFNQ